MESLADARCPREVAMQPLEDARASESAAEVLASLRRPRENLSPEEMEAYAAVKQRLGGLDRRRVAERILRQIDASQLSELRRDFYVLENRVAIDEFVLLMLRRMKSLSTREAADLRARSSEASEFAASRPQLPARAEATTFAAARSARRGGTTEDSDVLGSSARKVEPSMGRGGSVMRTNAEIEKGVVFETVAGGCNLLGAGVRASLRARASLRHVVFFGNRLSLCVSGAAAPQRPPHAESPRVDAAVKRPSREFSSEAKRQERSLLSDLEDALRDDELEDRPFAEGARDRSKDELPWLLKPDLPLLIDAFAAIDTEGAGVLTWEAFANALVDRGALQDGSAEKAEDADQYQFVGSTTLTDSRDRIEKLVYIDEVDRLFCLYCKAKTFSVVEPLQGSLDVTVAVPSGPLTDLCYIPSFGHLASAGADRSIRLWTTAAAPCRERVVCEAQPTCLGYLPKAEALLSGSGDGGVSIWDLQTMSLKGSRKRHSGFVNAVLALPQADSLFASASSDASILLWNAERLRPVRALEGHHKGVLSLAFSADYSCLLSAGLDKDAFVWSPCNFSKPISRLQGHPYALCGIAVIPNSPQVLTADASGALRLWDVRNFRCLQTFGSRMSSYGEMSSFCVMPRHRRLATGSTYLDFYEMKPVQRRTSLAAKTGGCADALFSAETDSILTTGKDKIHAWSAETGDSGTVLCASEREITAVSLDVGARRLYVGDSSGCVRSFNALTGAFLRAFAKHPCDVCHVCVWRTSTNFLSVSSDGLVLLQEQVGAGERANATSPDALGSAVADPRASESSLSSAGSSLVRYRAHLGSEGVHAIAVAGALEVVACAAGWKIQILCLKTLRKETSLKGLAGAARALDFFEPLNLLAAGDESGAISLWQPRTRQAPYLDWSCVYCWENLPQFDRLLLPPSASSTPTAQPPRGRSHAHSPPGALDTLGKEFAEIALAPGLSAADWRAAWSAHRLRHESESCAARDEDRHASVAEAANTKQAFDAAAGRGLSGSVGAWASAATRLQTRSSSSLSQSSLNSSVRPCDAREAIASPSAAEMRSRSRAAQDAAYRDSVRGGAAQHVTGAALAAGACVEAPQRAARQSNGRLESLTFTYRRKLRLDESDAIISPTAVNCLKFNAVEPHKLQVFTADEKGCLRCWSLLPLLGTSRLALPCASAVFSRSWSPPLLASALSRRSAPSLPDEAARRGAFRARLRQRGLKQAADVVGLQIQNWKHALLLREAATPVSSAPASSAASSARTIDSEVLRPRERGAEDGDDAEPPGREARQEEDECCSRRNDGAREASPAEEAKTPRGQSAAGRAKACEDAREASVAREKTNPTFITQLAHAGKLLRSEREGGDAATAKDGSRKEECGENARHAGRRKPRALPSRDDGKQKAASSEVGLLWERQAHADAILSMSVYASASLRGGPWLASARSAEEGETRGDGATFCGGARVSPPPAAAPAAVGCGAVPEPQSPSAAAGRGASSAEGDFDETAWLLTVGSDRLVKTWRDDGAALGKLSNDSSRFWTDLGHGQARWKLRLEQARDLLLVLAQRAQPEPSSPAASSLLLALSAARGFEAQGRTLGSGVAPSLGSLPESPHSARGASRLCPRPPPSLSPWPSRHPRTAARSQAGGDTPPRSEASARVGGSRERGGCRRREPEGPVRADKETQAERRRGEGDPDAQRPRPPRARSLSPTRSEEEGCGRLRGASPRSEEPSRWGTRSRATRGEGLATLAALRAMQRHFKRFLPPRNHPLSDEEMDAAKKFEECLLNASQRAELRSSLI
ncbi:hypothetical protein BESB_080150 [Besnoitia besnoiti]|uniref:EF-hand domain-containing protein n=1 Tax=Besnoitia besnoiti TaxID=94643 RepID=A0A2A9M781_BESBE|nr:hypothetical protein BESB_080150 [Besnoitia besnoiti]PFH33799.1 hypothetical protein BESB_080150 [Besnoitia besnoiti]